MSYMNWERLLLQAVRSLGGQARLGDIYSWLEQKAELTGRHLRSTIHGGRPAYQHQVRSHLSNLCGRGALVRIKTGIYGLPSGLCPKCGSNDWGSWTSSSNGRVSRYCRGCRRGRAQVYSRRKTVNGGSHTSREWEQKLREHDRCPNCDRRWNDIPSRPDSRYKQVWTKDHIVPVTHGGTDDIENLQPLCYRCNFEKCNSITRAVAPNMRLQLMKARVHLIKDRPASPRLRR